MNGSFSSMNGNNAQSLTISALKKVVFRLNIDGFRNGFNRLKRVLYNKH